jgi:membrane-associated protease RseP (regulator of RpoE activity)
MVVQDRGKMALLAALCTLASVAAGFALGTVAGSEATKVECTAAAPPLAAAPAPAPLPPAPPPPPRARLHLHGGHDWLHYWDPGIDIDIDGDAQRGWIGVTTQSDGNGAYITQVHPGSPAAAAGLKVGDTITEVDGEQVTTPAQLAHAIGDLEPGDKVKVHYLRNSKPAVADVTVGAR